MRRAHVESWTRDVGNWTRGQGEHVVDFVAHKVQPGTLIVVQPGNVHRFRLNASMDARLLVVDPVFMLPQRLAYLKALLGSEPWPARTQLTTSVCAELLDVCARLDADRQRKAAPALRAALARQRLDTWLLLLRIASDDADEPAPTRSGGVGPDGRFPGPDGTALHAALDRAGLRTQARLQRTLNRACLAYSDQSAKSLIDARVLLEAKRLLAHGNDSVDAISLRLGFNDSSSMCQFFKRLEGTTPTAFRSSVRRTAR